MSTAVSRPPFEIPARMVLMGVSGCGKSSVGAALQARTGARYVEGDALHPAANIAKMSAGIPLTDEDRWPWFELVAEALASEPQPVVVGCSSLKRIYRDFIRERAGPGVIFIHLSGSRAVIERRMRERTGHFMPPSLLDSQFATLELPQADERAVTVDIDQSWDGIVDDILKGLEALDRG